jgi:hypothetical protein
VIESKRSAWTSCGSGQFCSYEMHERNVIRVVYALGADAGFPLFLAQTPASGFGSAMSWEPAVISVVGVVAFNAPLEVLNVQSLACTTVSSGATCVAGAECNGASGHGIGGREGAIQASRTSWKRGFPGDAHCRNDEPEQGRQRPARRGRKPVARRSPKLTRVTKRTCLESASGASCPGLVFKSVQY